MWMLRDAIKRIWWEICEGCWLKVENTHTHTSSIRDVVGGMMGKTVLSLSCSLALFDMYDVMSYVCIWWLNEIRSRRANDSLYAGNLFTHGFVSLMCDNIHSAEKDRANERDEI